MFFEVFDGFIILGKLAEVIKVGDFIWVGIEMPTIKGGVIISEFVFAAHDLIGKGDVSVGDVVTIGKD